MEPFEIRPPGIWRSPRYYPTFEMLGVMRAMVGLLPFPGNKI
jgi:hypothetical protein